VEQSPRSRSSVIQIGTTGFAYKDWVNNFYPKGTTKKEMLTFYARHFPVVEIVSSYYTVPTRKSIDALLNRGGSEMTFVMRLHREILNARTGGLDNVHGFLRAITPVIRAHQLGAVLVQLPWAFACTDRNFRYLSDLAQGLSGLPVVTEFRNPRWDHEESYCFLTKLGWGYCTVDQPRLKGLVTTIDRVTSRVACVRLHGRNADSWWKSDRALRFDYLYSREELREWLPRLRRIAARVDDLFVFTANHYQGQAVKTARAIRRLLNG